MAGGMIVILELLLNDSKTGPTSAVCLDLRMLFKTVGKERTVAEYKDLLESENFNGFQYLQNAGSTHFEVIVARKA